MSSPTLIPEITNQDIEAAIEERIGEVRTGATDISFGEIINLHAAKPSEIIIQPDYQRLFRWTDNQRSRLIESILLGLPVPQIFVIENSQGVYELIDGLQRISSIFHFVDHTLIQPDDIREKVAPGPLKLTGCDLVPQLNGKVYKDLSMRLQLKLKRTSVRMVAIQKSENQILPYEMFKRLNSGGSDLSSQEIRNCTSRMAGKQGVDFYKFLTDCAADPNFVNCTDSIPDSTRERRGDEELVLRFFATKNSRDSFVGNVTDWLDDYMDSVIFSRTRFDYPRELSDFRSTFAELKRLFGSGSFVKYRGGRPTGALAPAYFEAVSGGAFLCIKHLKNVENQNKITAALAALVESDDFRGVTGPGANSKEKLNARVQLVRDCFQAVN